MPGMLAATFNLNWDTMTVVGTVLAIIGSVLGLVVYKAIKVFNNLAKGDEERKTKIVNEDNALREQLLNRYKEMFETEKDRSTREIQDLNAQMVNLRRELEFVRQRQKEVQEENDRLRELNLKYQQDKRQDAHTIANLQQNVESLQTQIDHLRSKLGEDTGPDQPAHNNDQG